MAKKSVIDRELEKARALLAEDRGFSDVLKRVTDARKDSKQSKPSPSRRLRLPYVDAEPLNVTSWK